MNAVEIEQAVSEPTGQPFDVAEFPFAFLAAFGNKDTPLKRLRTGNSNASDIPGAALLHNNIHIAACQPGSVGETLRRLRASPATVKAKAKFILATDGQIPRKLCTSPRHVIHFARISPLSLLGLNGWN
ncbi:MAG: hypothetical protein FWC58_05910 [Desulfobulbus sp.]|nr:hypothetical protein [Desulfobulbus sp.]